MCNCFASYETVSLHSEQKILEQASSLLVQEAYCIFFMCAMICLSECIVLNHAYMCVIIIYMYVSIMYRFVSNDRKLSKKSIMIVIQTCKT